MTGLHAIMNRQLWRGRILVRRVFVTAAGVLAGSGMGVAAATAGTVVGTLAGQTQISYGCPGPVAEGGPSCNPWRTFAQARFSVSASSPSGRAQIVVSDGLGRFSLRLAPGNYTVTSLPQAHTRGGTTLQIRVRPGAVTRIVVRFQGYPMME
jgi:hypothetical protein